MEEEAKRRRSWMEGVVDCDHMHKKCNEVCVEVGFDLHIEGTQTAKQNDVKDQATN